VIEPAMTALVSISNGKAASSRKARFWEKCMA
jgi:hypothetical protein